MQRIQRILLFKELNKIIWKLLVQMRVIGNYFFERWYRKYSFERRYLEITAFKNGISKLLVSMTILRNYLFERCHLVISCSNCGIGKLPVVIVVLRKYFLKDRVSELLVWMMYLKVSCLINGIWEIFLWMTVYRNYLFQWWRYLKTTSSNNGVFQTICLKEGIWRLVVWNMTFRKYLKGTYFNDGIWKLLV